MKKDVRVVLLVFPLLLLGADLHAGVVEVSANATDADVPIVNSNADSTNNRMVSDGVGNKSGGLEKGSKEKTENYNEKESFSAAKDKKPLEEPKSKNSDGNHNLSNVANSTAISMEDSHLEGCDLSNSCVDQKHKFIACLRVSGQVLQVRALVKDEVSDSTITLQAKDGNCSLNLRNTVLTSVKNETSKTTRFLDLATHITVSMLLFAAVSAGGAWLCIRFWRRRASRYQKVDVLLPVSKGGSKETDGADSWGGSKETDGADSWGDDWDEEAPKTPSKPVSTLKGLASRRVNRDGWKD